MKPRDRVRYSGSSAEWRAKLSGLVGKVVFISPINRLVYVEYPGWQEFVCSRPDELTLTGKNNDLFMALI